MKILLCLTLLLSSGIASAQAMSGFTPSTVSGEQLQSLRKVMKKGYKPKSQCYNRAHYWAYQLETKKNVKAMKVFMFFSKKFMNLDGFDWWFHVSPAVMVEGDSEPQMLDIYLWNGPVSLSFWMDHFLQMGGSPQRECKKIEKYSDYTEDRFNAHCYIMYTAPQYIEPTELEELEMGHPKAPEYIDSEVQTARRQAFWL
jgi:hypothetical protein